MTYLEMICQRRIGANRHARSDSPVRRYDPANQADLVPTTRSRYPARGLLAVMALVTAGCSTVYEGRYDFNDGWREGEVLEIAPASAIKSPQFSDCRESSSPEQLATYKFALVAFNHLGRIQRQVAPLADASGLKLGELVYINITNCSAQIMPRSRGWRISR